MALDTVPVWAAKGTRERESEREREREREREKERKRERERKRVEDRKLQPVAIVQLYVKVVSDWTLPKLGRT